MAIFKGVPETLIAGHNQPSVSAYGMAHVIAATFLLVGAITAFWIKTNPRASKLEIMIE